MTTTVIVAGARTPFGRLLGGLSGFSAAELGAMAITRALELAQVDADTVQSVILGHAIQAGAGQNPARQAAILGGIPARVDAVTVNKVCLSGTNAIMTADRMIRSGDASVIIAGGMESMSNAPHVLLGLRRGVKFGDTSLIDTMVRDGLWDYLTDQSMGGLTDATNTHSREEQDAFAAESHRRAILAHDTGAFDTELVPVTPARGETVTRDEGPRSDTSLESLGRLRPAFGGGGSITAGSSSPISDGACAVVLMSRERAEELGLPWLAEIIGHGEVAGPDSTLQSQPARALAQAAKSARVDVHDLRHIEINEAFASVALTSTRELGVDPAIVNPHGGAIAIGHPLGASGARVALHAALMLAPGELGGAALCGGGGQGDALVLRARQ